MSTIDKGSFLDSYAQEAAEIQPTESQLLRAYQNIELADNADAEQAEQQRLLAPRGPSPEMQSQLEAANAYAMSFDDANDITLAEESLAADDFAPWGQVKQELDIEPTSDFETYGAEGALLRPEAAPDDTWRRSEFETFGEEGALLQPEGAPLSKPPVYTPPAFEAPDTFSPFEGKDMAVEAQNIQRASRPLGDLKNYDSLPFKSAFRAALDDGLQTFAWKGQQYTTQTKEKLKVAKEKEVASRHALLAPEESRTTNIADLPLYEEPSFSDSLGDSGYTVKGNAATEGVRPEMSHAVRTVAPIFKELGIDSDAMVLTSGKRDSGGWSYHETGDAVDLQFRPEEVFPGVTGDELTSKVKEVENKIVEKLGAGWVVVLSEHGSAFHLHIQQENEASRLRLNQHGVKHDIKPSDIKNAASRAKYETFKKGLN